MIEFVLLNDFSLLFLFYLDVLVCVIDREPSYIFWSFVNFFDWVFLEMVTN